MRILIYEAMPDITRAEVILGIAAQCIKQGHIVFLLLDEEVHLLSRNHIKHPHAVSCLNIIRARIAPSKIPFYAVPANKTLKRLFDNNPDKNTLNKIQEYKCSHYKYILESFKPDEIIIWNGLMDYQQGFIQLAKKYNPQQKFKFLEAGWFPQKGHYYHDSKGVNAASSIAEQPPKKLSQKETNDIERWKNSYRKRHGNYNICDKGYYFIPLQLESDTNITLFSPFQTMENFLKWILKNSDSKIPLIVRPHPLDHIKKIHLKKLSPRITIDSSTPLQKLIAESKIVIGINSTVLLESLIYDKPTVALGRGIFQSSEAIHLQDVKQPIPKELDFYHVYREYQNAFLHQLRLLQHQLPTFKDVQPLLDGIPIEKSTRYSKFHQKTSMLKILLKQYSNKTYTKLSKYLHIL